MKVVEESWNEEGVEGWGCFVFKEKLKRLNEKLKVWNKEEFGFVDQNIIALRDKLHEFDICKLQ